MKTLYFITVLFLFISCSESKDVTPPSSSNKILSFSVELNGTKTLATIDTTNKTINLSLVSGTDISNLVPTITTSPLSTITPLSGVKQDFSKPVIYTVKAENGSIKQYTVSVTLLMKPTVFVGSHDNYLYAIDALSGKLFWKFKTNGEVVSSPTLSKGIVYVGSSDGNIYAIDAFKGTKIWSYSLRGNVYSPIVVNDVVYVAVENYVFAIDAKTGNKLWSTNFYPSGYILSSNIEFIRSTPTYYNGVIYIGSWDKKLYALDAKSGLVKWTFVPSADGDFLSNPVIKDAIIYFGVGKTFYAVDANTGKSNWEFTVNLEILSSPFIDNNMVYFTTDNKYNFSRQCKLYALSLPNGELKWNIDIFRSDSSPILYNNVLYIASNKSLNSIGAVDAITQKKIWWDTSVSIEVNSSPTIANNLVYIGNDNGNFYAIDIHSGKTQWTYITGGAIFSSPCVTDLYGNVYHSNVSGY